MLIDPGNEPVTAARKCLDETGRRGGIPERLTQALDCCIQAAFEIDEGTFGPQLVSQIVPRHQRSTLANQDREEPEWLVRQKQALTLVRQLARLQVQLEFAEPHELGPREA